MQRTTRVLDFGDETGNIMANEKRLRLSLASPEDIAKQMSVVTLSTSDSSFGTPTSQSTDVSFSTDELPNTDDLDTTNIIPLTCKILDKLKGSEYI